MSISSSSTAAEIASSTAGVEIGWADWVLGFLPVGLPLVAAVPLLAYVVHPPELKARTR